MQTTQTAPVADPPESTGISGAANFNQVQLMGRLTWDPELRYTKSGVAVANFGLAVNRPIHRPDGGWDSQSLLFRINVWKQAAERCSERLRKGSPLFLVGHFEMEEWVDKGGVPQSRQKIVADHIEFLEKQSKGQSAPAPTGSLEGAAPEVDDTPVPF